MQNDSHLKKKCNCCNRREFLKTSSLVLGYTGASLLIPPLTAKAATFNIRKKQGANVRAAFLYPPSKTFADNPDGWWSWPGNDFDAEGRQRKYNDAIRKMEKSLGMRIKTENSSIANSEDAQRLAKELEASQPDGLLLIMFYNRSLGEADLLLETAKKLNMPVVFFIGLGVKHGSIEHYRRPGVYFIQSLDNLKAIEYGMRMINAKKRIAQSTILSITDDKSARNAQDKFLGTNIRAISHARYADVFNSVSVSGTVQETMKTITNKATEIRHVTKVALENAMRAHFALEKLLNDENADGVAMNCLRLGMLKPCISFSILNNKLIPAACENDIPAACTQILGQMLTQRPGFQHNPCYETEKNHYYASHCTCPTKVYGPDGPELKYLLRPYAHSNEGSCAIQVFWEPEDTVTMVRYYPGEKPALDVYSGRVVKSHQMPPAGGCTTNVEIKITDREDACMVKGHHNLLFCGNLARRFRLFAQLYKMELANTGYDNVYI